MPTFTLYLTNRGVRVVKIIIIAAIFVSLASGFYMLGGSAMIASLDREAEIVKPLDEMRYVSKVQDDGECYYIFKDNENSIRWYRLITIDDSVNFVSYYPAIIECDDNLLIRVRWDPNEYVDCKTFLRMAGEYNGLIGKGEVGFCQRYHLPINKIKAVCGGF